MQFGEQIEERRLFSFEERKQILKNSSGICACCGKKLTTKTMTVEHIIPLSRGGTNDDENLIALCYDCNTLKGNMIYMPYGFYLALKDSPRFNKMEQHVTTWFQTIRDEFDIEHFPLIAPSFYVMVVPDIQSYRYTSKEPPFLRQLLLKWNMIGSERYAEIEAVTNLNIKEIRQKVKDYCHNDEQSVILYSLEKVTNQKFLAVVAIAYSKETKDMYIYMPWCDILKSALPSILSQFTYNALYVITSIANYDVNYYTLISPIEDSMSYFHKRKVNPIFGFGYEPGGKCKNEQETDYILYCSRVDKNEWWNNMNQKSTNQDKDESK